MQPGSLQPLDTHCTEPAPELHCKHPSHTLLLMHMSPLSAPRRWRNSRPCCQRAWLPGLLGRGHRLAGSSARPFVFSACFQRSARSGSMAWHACYRCRAGARPVLSYCDRNSFSPARFSNESISDQPKRLDQVSAELTLVRASGNALCNPEWYRPVPLVPVPCHCEDCTDAQLHCCQLHCCPVALLPIALLPSCTAAQLHCCLLHCCPVHCQPPLPETRSNSASYRKLRPLYQPPTAVES